jgi:hypothetical protein
MLQGAHQHIWNGVVGSVKEILDLILTRTQEGSARAVLRWNGRTRIPPSRRDGDLGPGSSDGEVTLETDGFGIQDIERPYSCVASWEM